MRLRGSGDHGGILGDAGWSDVGFVPHTLDLYAGGPGPVENAVEIGLTIGALQLALTGAPPEVVDATRAALTADLARRPTTVWESS